MSIRLLCGLIGAIMCWMTAQAIAQSPSGQEPIKIGLSGPFSGPSSPTGVSMRAGIRLAAAQVNARGGVMGRTVQLVEMDDAGSNEQAAQVARRLIEEEGVVASIGMVNTGAVLASQGLYQEARKPLLTAVATGTLLTRQFQPPQHPDNFIFRVAATDHVQAEAMVRELADRRGLTRIAVFHDASNYGQIGRDDLLDALRDRGLQPAVVERVQLRQRDMSSQVFRARAMGVEAILVYGSGAELAHLAHTIKRLDWHPIVIGSWTLSMASFIDTSGVSAEGMLMPLTFIHDDADPRHAHFAQNWMRDPIVANWPVTSAAAQGHDGLLILAAAIEQANSADGDAIREALENLEGPVEGLIQTYRRPFSKNNHEAFQQASALRIGVIRDGQVVDAHGTSVMRGSRP